MNFRITDLQCAVGLAQLRKLPAIIERKQAHWERYRRNLNGAPGLRLMQTQPDSTLVPFRCPILTDQRDTLAQALEAAGIQTRTFFHPLHRQPCLTRYARGPLPVCDDLYEHGICLPIHPQLGPTDIDHISDTILQTLTRSPGPSPNEGLYGLRCNSRSRKNT